MFEAVRQVKKLELQRFTAFEDATLEFSPGVNVFIGENGTGKSHLLKLLYVLNEAARGEGRLPDEKPASLSERIAALLQGVFQPDTLGRLVRRGVGRRKATISVTWSGDEDCSLEVSLSNLGRIQTSGVERGTVSLERSVFIPTREVLSIFPGFIAAYQRRESSFDRTHYDLCVALDAKPLRGPRDEIRKKILQPIERALGGRVINDGGRFYLALPDGNMEAPLVAEGLRKLAMLDYLAANGSLTANGFLFWDEPEANMNPKLTRLAGETIFGLADAMVQAFVATHDYVLTREMALTAESRSRAAAFFALGRSDETTGSFVEAARTLSELQTNPILQALADLHSREERAFSEPTVSAPQSCRALSSTALSSISTNRGASIAGMTLLYS